MAHAVGLEGWATGFGLRAKCEARREAEAGLKGRPALNTGGGVSQRQSFGVCRQDSEVMGFELWVLSDGAVSALLKLRAQKDS